MIKPNNFSLINIPKLLRELTDYLDGNTAYDLYLLQGAADTVDQYLDDNDITLLENENDNTKTTESKKENNPATPESEGFDTDTGIIQFPN